jgi:membrane-bound lytic murein transglycosylase D
VPQLLAATAIATEPERFGFERPAGASMLFDSVLVHRSVDFGWAARALGLDRGAIAELNPQFIRGVTPPGSPSWVRVPVGLGPEATTKLRTAPVAPSAPRTYLRVRVKRGDTVESIADRNGVTVEQLRRTNALPRSYPLRPGQVLWIRTG